MSTPHDHDRVGVSRKSESRSRRRGQESPKRLFRVLRLVSMLSQERPVPIRNIRKAFRVSERTVCRDVRFLREFGFNIETTVEGYYLERASFSLPSLNEKEIEALGAMQRFLDASESSFPLTPEASRALKKTLSLLAPAWDVQEGIGRFLSYWLHPATASENDLNTARSLLRIIEAGKCCEIVLRVPQNGQAREKFRCIPLHLEYAFGGWQVYGLSETENRMVAFPLSRIEKLSRPCQPRDADHVQNLQKKMQHSRDRSRVSNTYDIVLTIRPQEADGNVPMKWHPLQEVYERQSGSVRISFPAIVDDHLVQEILRFGPVVEVIEPRFLREHVVRIVRQTADQYAVDKKSAKREQGAPFRFRTSVQGFRALRVRSSRAS